jgi:hypothetical protein
MPDAAEQAAQGKGRQYNPIRAGLSATNVGVSATRNHNASRQVDQTSSRSTDVTCPACNAALVLTVPTITRKDLTRGRTPLAPLASDSEDDGMTIPDTPPPGQQEALQLDEKLSEYKRLVPWHVIDNVCTQCKGCALLRMSAAQFNFLGACGCDWLLSLRLKRTYYEEGRHHVI